MWQNGTIRNYPKIEKQIRRFFSWFQHVLKFQKLSRILLHNFFKQIAYLKVNVYNDKTSNINAFSSKFMGSVGASYWYVNVSLELELPPWMINIFKLRRKWSSQPINKVRQGAAHLQILKLEGRGSTTCQKKTLVLPRSVLQKLNTENDLQNLLQNRVEKNNESEESGEDQEFESRKLQTTVKYLIKNNRQKFFLIFCEFKCQIAMDFNSLFTCKK